MKFTNRINCVLFLLLIVVNLLLRSANHERMIDSYEMHILANSISEFGEALWWENPLSIFGMYINSYASMISFFSSGISQITGFDIEYSIFIYSIIFGLFSIFASYTLAGILYDDDLYKFIVSFGFSLSSGVVTYTTWTGNARSPFIIILPLFLYTLFKSGKNHLKFKFISLIIAMLLFTTHHLAFYLFPILIAYLLVGIIYKININKYINCTKLNDLLPLITASAFLFMFSFAFLNHKFQTASSRWVNLGFMINEYPRYIGILVFLSIGGLFYLLFKKNKRKEEWNLLMVLVMFTPFIFQVRYSKWFVLIFASLLAGIGFLNLNRASILNNNKKYISIMFIFLITSVSFTGFFQYIHNPSIEVDHNQYITSLWIKQFTEGNYISNNRWYGWIIAAISGNHFLTGSQTADQAYGFVEVNEFNVTKYPITSEEFWLSSPYKKISGTSSDGYWQIIMERDIYSNWNKGLIDKFEITWLLRKTSNYNYWVSHHGNKPSPFVNSIITDKYCVYDSGDFDIWTVT